MYVCFIITQLLSDRLCNVHVMPLSCRLSKSGDFFLKKKKIKLNYLIYIYNHKYIQSRQGDPAAKSSASTGTTSNNAPDWFSHTPKTRR